MWGVPSLLWEGSQAFLLLRARLCLVDMLVADFGLLRDEESSTAEGDPCRERKGGALCVDNVLRMRRHVHEGLDVAGKASEDAAETHDGQHADALQWHGIPDTREGGGPILVRRYVAPARCGCGLEGAVELGNKERNERGGKGGTDEDGHAADAQQDVDMCEALVCICQLGRHKSYAAQRQHQRAGKPHVAETAVRGGRQSPEPGYVLRWHHKTPDDAGHGMEECVQDWCCLHMTFEKGIAILERVASRPDRTVYKLSACCFGCTRVFKLPSTVAYTLHSPPAETQQRRGPHGYWSCLEVYQSCRRSTSERETIQPRSAP